MPRSWARGTTSAVSPSPTARTRTPSSRITSNCRCTMSGVLTLDHGSGPWVSNPNSSMASRTKLT